MIRQVVFDTSTLVSAALRAGSVPYHALLQAFAACEVCASIETLAELERVLENRKFDRYLDSSLRQAFLGLVRRHVHVFALQTSDLEALDPPCRDPKDNCFLALALVAEADALISSDSDLLVLHPWRGIAILNPQNFLSASKDISAAGAEAIHELQVSKRKRRPVV